MFKKIKQFINNLFSKKAKETAKQLYWRQYFTKNINDSGDDSGKLSFELYVNGDLKKGFAQIMPWGIDRLINPDYEVYSLIKEIYMLYIDSYGGSDLACSSSHFNNALMLLAAIYDCAGYEQTEEWCKRFELKNEDKFKLKNQK